MGGNFKCDMTYEVIFANIPKFNNGADMGSNFTSMAIETFDQKSNALVNCNHPGVSLTSS
jgi:hypothetical protein